VITELHSVGIDRVGLAVVEDLIVSQKPGSSPTIKYYSAWRSQKRVAQKVKSAYRIPDNAAQMVETRREITCILRSLFSSSNSAPTAITDVCRQPCFASVLTPHA
jgi:hypothetical protein